ncbi:MAG: InlB B-repeat-containing protein [bacterium]|nr:InlB B-repeat-containing protein [bacterium]MDY4098769.1 InlB B-repeat-containing protein [Lachnospiraceae bacterium]
MRKNKIYQIAKQMLALVLTLSLVLGLTPAMPATTVQAASNGLPKEALTATANQTLKSDRIYCVETNITINGGANQAGLIVGSTAYIYIAAGCTLTVKGGNASSNSVGGQPGIYLPSGRTLYVTGEGTLKVTGGAGARAGDGGGGGSGSVIDGPTDPEDVFTGGSGGNGGSGASGGGAGIGTAGGAGGSGGSGGIGLTHVCNKNDYGGVDGGSGNSGSGTDPAGTLYLYGAVKVYAYGGSPGSSGSGGSPGSNASRKWENEYFAGGGGGGGGGGRAKDAAGIGAGGAGGGGGGGGGSGATNYSDDGKNTYKVPGKGGFGGSLSGSTGSTGDRTISGSSYQESGSGGSSGSQGYNGYDGMVYKDKDVAVSGRSSVGTITVPPYPPQFTYQVTPDNNKGSGSTEPQGASISPNNSEVTLGYPVNCSDGWSVPTRVGYTFAGYNEKWDGTGREYVKYYPDPDAPDGQNFQATGRWNVAGDTTIYAQWTPNPYKVLLKRNNAATPAAITDSDGSGNIENYTTGTTEVTAYFDQTMPTGIEIPQRVGYTFLGYYEAPVADDVDDATIDSTNTRYYDENGDPTAATWTKPEDNHVLYARWKRTTYKIAYEANGGTYPEDESITKYEYTYGDTYDLPSDVNKSEGKQDFIFEGWYLNDTFTTDQIKTIYPANFGNKKYYAKWTPIKGTRADSELLTIPAGTFPYTDPETGEEKLGKIEEYDYTQVYTLINGKPAQVDRVELRSGSGPNLRSYVCASDDTGAYGYYSKGSIGKAKIYINGRDTGKTVKSDSNEEIALATAEVTVSKDDVLLTGADVQLRRTDADNHEIIHYLTDNEDGTYSYLWLEDANEYHIYVNGEDSGKCISLVGGDTQELSYYTIRVQTKRNDALSEVGPVILRSGETELSLTETEKDSGIFEIVSVEDPTVYKVYVDDEKTSQEVSFTSGGRNALQDYYDVEVTTRKDGAPSYIGKVELKSGDTVLAVNGADGNYRVRGQLDATKSYDIYVDGADSGQDARFTSSERRHTIDYYTVTVNVTRNGEPINEASGVTLKAPGRSSIPLTWMDTGVYKTVQPASDTVYQIWFGSENTGRTVKFQPGNNTATIDYYGLTLNLREDDAVVSNAAITLVADGAIVANFEFNTGEGSYQSQIRGAGTYDIYRDGADTGADFVVSSTNKEASVDYYTVSYDGDGADAGQTLVAPYLVRAGAEVRVTSQRLTKTGEAEAGYQFGGWKLDDDEKIYKAKDTFTMPNHAVTLKAVWIANADCEAKWTYEANGSQVTEYGTMDQALEEAANKYGKVTVSIVKADASVHVTTSAELKSATTLVIKAGQTLILDDGVTITNRGMIKNNGSISKAGQNAWIQNEAKGVIDQSAEGENFAAGTIGCDVTGSGTIGFGTIASGATVTGARLWGAIENHGTIINPSEIISDTGVFTNAQDGNLTIQSGNSLTVNGTLNNQGALTNAGTLELSEETALTNAVGSNLSNNGTLTAKANGGNAAYIENKGMITNGAGAMITLQSVGGKSASMSNTGEVSNAGVISLTMAATLDTTNGTVTNSGSGYVLAYRYVSDGDTITDTIDGETITFKPQVIGINKVTGPHQVVYVYVTTEQQLLESASVHLNGIQMGADITLNQNLTLSEGASLWIPEGRLLEVSDTSTVTVTESSSGMELDGTIWMQSKESDGKLVIADQKLDQSETGRIYYQFSASISETEKVLGINETFVLRASTDAQAGGVCTYTWYEKGTLCEQAIFAATGAALSFEWNPAIGEKTYFCRITWEDAEHGVFMTADTPECTISSKSTTDVTLSAESLHVSEVIAQGETTKFGKDLANCNSDWTVTIKADTGYLLPTSISVTIGGVPVLAGIGYTYDPATGEITIKSDKIRGPIVITAKATPITYQIRYDIRGAEGAPSLGERQEDGSFVQTVSFEDTLTLADVGTLTSTDGIFKGWATSETAAEPEYAPGRTLDAHFKNTQDDVQNLYAVWRVKAPVDAELLKDTTTDPADPNYGKSLIEIVSASALVYNGAVQKPIFTLPEQTAEPRFTVKNEGGTDVGTYYVELTLSDAAYEYYQWPKSEGVTVSGAALLISYEITQATNEFTTSLTCRNVTYGTKLAPSAASKFGVVKYRYRADEEEAWSNTVPTNVGTYQVQAYVTGTENYTALESDPLEVTIQKGVYTAPSTTKVKAVDETIEGKKDGRLSGLTTEMEYRKVGTVSWSAITVDILTENGPRNLEAGDYEVRYAESENAEASPAVTLTVHPGRKLVATYQAEKDTGIVTVATQETIWGGSVSPGAIEVPARTGYSSVGWSGQYENLETDVTLTAIYSSKYIKVTLDANGGTLPIGENCIYESYGHGYYDSAGGAMSATSDPVKLPSKTGYTFLGYYTGQDDGTCYIGADGTITEEANNRYFTGADDETAVLYAHWQMTAYEYKIVKASNADVKVSGEGAYKSTIGYDDPRRIVITSTSESGFNGDSIYVYINGSVVDTLTMTENSSESIAVKVDLKELGKLGNVLISIGEEPVSHKVTYKYADGDVLAGTEITSGMPEDTPYVFLEKSGLSGLVTPIRNGYTFEGWYRTADCSQEAVTTIPARTRTDVTLYAKWSRNTYQVAYDRNGGVISDSSGNIATQYTFSESQNVELPKAVTKTGYVFAGWYLSAALDGTRYSSIPAGMTGNLTFYAKWEDQICTVTKKEAAGVTYHTLSASDQVKYGAGYKFTVETNSAYNGENMKVLYYETGTSGETKEELTLVDGVYTINPVRTDITIVVDGVKEMPLTPMMKIQRFVLDENGKVNDFSKVWLDSFVKWGTLPVTDAHYEYRIAGSSNWTILDTEIFSTGVKLPDKNQINFQSTELSGLSAGQEYEVRLIVSDGIRTKVSDPIAFQMPVKDADPPQGKITGTVSTADPPSSIPEADKNKTFSVSLNEGSTSIAVLYNVGNGETFAFSELPDGEYNLVVIDNETQYQVTRMVTVEDGKTKNIGIIIVKPERQTKVVVKEDAPKVAVDQLNKVYDAVKDVENPSESVQAIQEASSRVASEGGILSLNLIAEKSEESEQKSILNNATVAQAVTDAAIAMSLNLTAELVETYDDTSRMVTPINDTYQKLLIAIPMDDLMKQLLNNGTTLYVYREHEDDNGGKRVEKMEERTDTEIKTDGSEEGFYANKDAGYLYLRANKFSTYAVVYDNTKPVTPQTPESSGGGGGPVKPKDPVVAPPQTFDKNDPKDVDITWDGNKNPQQVTMDDKTMDPKDYKSGDKKLTLPKDYLDGLEPGDHTVTIYFDDGTSQKVVITIAEKQEPKPDQPDKPTDSGDTNITVSKTFHKLPLAEAKATKNAVKVSWKKVTGADGYVLYGAPCNTKDKTYKMKKLAVIKNGSKITYTDKKLKSGTYYKYYIKAYKLVNGKKVWLAQSKVIHVTTSGGKYGNAKAVKVSRTKVALKKGKSLIIKASQIAGNKPIKQHTDIKFESTNTKIATVTRNGRIKAKKKGICYIYVYAQNGMYKRIKVTVK